MKVFFNGVFGKIKLHELYTNGVLVLMIFLVGFCMLKACDSPEASLGKAGQEVTPVEMQGHAEL